MPRWDVGHLPGCRCYPEDTLKSALKLRATLCCKKIKKNKKKSTGKKHTKSKDVWPSSPMWGASHNRASSLTSGSLQDGVDWMAGLGTKKWFTVPHTYSKCMWGGKPLLPVPLDGRTAVRRRVSARLPQDTSSGLVLRSRSRSLLTKSCLDTRVTEVMNSTDPSKHYGLLPRGGKSSQGRA